MKGVWKMSRLIDADALIETMKKVETEYEDAMTCPSWWTAYSVISEQPTAYDVEKVENALKNHPNVFQEFKGSYIPLENAVEVVQSNDGKGWWNDSSVKD